MRTLRQRAYRFGQEIARPVFRGLVGLIDDSSGPLVEIAMDSLLSKRDIPPELRITYMKRILVSATTEQIYKLIMNECPKDEQEVLVKAFDLRYAQTKTKFDEKIQTAESGMHASNLFARCGEYKKITLVQTRDMLTSGKLTSEKAQQTLASIIWAEGTEQQAREILERGSVIGFAQHILLFKCREQPGQTYPI